jgi:hypothetical protein
MSMERTARAAPRWISSKPTATQPPTHLIRVRWTRRPDARERIVATMLAGMLGCATRVSPFSLTFVVELGATELTVITSDGCDFNSFRMGDQNFYGPAMSVDTTKPFTLVTQFITDDGTDTGTLKSINRFYVQDGKVIPNSVGMFPPMPRVCFFSGMNQLTPTAFTQSRGRGCRCRQPYQRRLLQAAKGGVWRQQLLCHGGRPGGHGQVAREDGACSERLGR